MAEPATVAVEATEARYRALKHYPSQTGFEADGTARWPADAFTFRLAEEGAIRLLEDLHDRGVQACPGLRAGRPDGHPPAGVVLGEDLGGQ